jgi:hypothetical protein
MTHPGNSVSLEPVSLGRRTCRAALLAALLAAPIVNAQETTTLFVPVVLSSSGRSGSFFTSEMVETNKGSLDATVSYLYTDATGGTATGSATNPQPLAAGRQRVIPDVIAYLRNLGVPIPAAGNAVGTLRATFTNLHAASDAAITVRTTTPVPTSNPTGRAGLAYSGVPPLGLLYSGTTAFLCGLKQNALDRTNVAVQNGGASGDGDITLHVTFVPSLGTPSADQVVTLSPGGFRQFTLTDLNPSAADGFVRVTESAGSAPFYAYAVVNDQVNSDGSFIAPVKSGTGVGIAVILMPTVVETSVYTTEVVLTNLSAGGVTGVLTFASASLTAPNNLVTVPVSLSPYEQRTYPSFVQSLRLLGVAGVPAAGGTIVGTLSFQSSNGDTSSVFLGGRTLNPGGGGRYGVFTSGQPDGTGADTPGTWVYGLRQDAQNRTNLALVNLGNVDFASIGLHVDFFDGATGLLAGSTDQIVPYLGFLQLNTVLSQYAPSASQACARITRTQGNSRFVSYAVVNDGAAPGQRSGDGAVVPMDPFDVFRYAGTWNNTTFGSSGSAKATLAAERASALIAVTLDLGGNVFGGTAPGPQTIHGTVSASGASLSDTTPLFGPITAVVSPLGLIGGTAPSVPGPNVSALSFNGTINPGVSVNLNYTATLRPSGTAMGTVTMTPAP